MQEGPGDLRVQHSLLGVLHRISFQLQASPPALETFHGSVGPVSLVLSSDYLVRFPLPLLCGVIEVSSSLRLPIHVLCRGLKCFLGGVPVFSFLFLSFVDLLIREGSGKSFLHPEIRSICYKS